MRIERGVIVFLLLAAVGVLSFFIPPFYAAMLIPCAAIGVFFLGNTRAFLLVYVMVMGVYPLLKDVIRSTPVGYLNEFMGLILFGMFFGQVAFRKLDFSCVKKWKFGFGLFAGWFFLMWLFNLSPPKPMLQTLFLYLSFIPFYILSVNFLSRRDLPLVLAGTVAFFWLNFALNMGWRLGVNPLYNAALMVGGLGLGSGMFDAAKGTFSSQTIMAYFCVMLIFIFGAIQVKRWRVFGRWTSWVMIPTLIALFVQLYLTYTNHAYLYAVLAAIPFVFLSKLWKSGKAMAGFAVVVLAVLLTFSFSEELKDQFSQEKMDYRQKKLAYSAKVLLFNDLLVKNRRDNPSEWMFGVGPGNGMGDIGKDSLSPFALRMLLPYYQSADAESAQMSSILGNTHSAIFFLWGDFGLVGFFLFLMIYFRLVMLILKKNRATNAATSALSIGLLGAVSMLLLTNITFDVFAMTGVTCWLWMLAALISLPDEEASQKEDLS